MCRYCHKVVPYGKRKKVSEDIYFESNQGTICSGRFTDYNFNITSTFKTESSMSKSVVFSSLMDGDNKLFATGEGIVCTYNSKTGKYFENAIAKSWISCMVNLPYFGSYVICSDNLYVVDSTTMNISLILYMGHSDHITSVERVGHNIIASSGCEDSYINIWSLTNVSSSKTIMLPCKYVIDLLNVDIGKILCSSVEGYLFIVDIEKNELVSRMESEESVVYPSEHLCMPTPNVFTSASENFKVDLWDLRTCTKFNSMAGHTEAITKIMKYSEGKVVSIGQDNMLNLWDLNGLQGSYKSPDDLSTFC